MNKGNLKRLFKSYIDNFEMINNKENNETYKWEIAQEYQRFNVDAIDFSEMLSQMCKHSGNLIDNSQQLPFYAMVEYACREPETVREMFRALYADEYIDTTEKQVAIDNFIMTAEKLRIKYFPDSRLYVNNQRSVMMYLFLRYPDSNFGYKAQQAKSFADCIEFYEDWGPMTAFHLDVFERMCKSVLNEMKNNEALLETQRSRFENTNRILYPDENLHILLFDIIFSSQTYDFYNGITFDPINAKSRKLYFERVAKAKELAAKVEKAKADSKALDEAKEYIQSSITEGMVIYHKAFGEGIIKKCDGLTITVCFDKINDTKALNPAVVIGNGLGTFPSSEITERIKGYAPILNREYQIPSALSRAVDELQPYLDYLD